MFNMVITPTLTCASGTRTLSREHERMIKSAQRKMIRLLFRQREDTRIRQNEKKRRSMTSQKKMKKNQKLVKKTVPQMKKQKKDQSHARTAIKTVIFLFMKTKMKKLTKKRRMGRIYQQKYKRSGGSNEQDEDSMLDTDMEE